LYAAPRTALARRDEPSPPADEPRFRVDRPSGCGHVSAPMRRAVVLSLLFVTACSAKMPPLATALDAERANVQLGDLNAGRQMYIAKCKGCHGLPMPTDYTPAEWPKKVTDMAERSKVDDAQRRAIEQYLVVMSTPSPQPAAKK
jgi:hypothetical protein